MIRLCLCILTSSQGQSPESGDIPLDGFFTELPLRADGKHFGVEPGNSTFSRKDGEILCLYDWMNAGYHPEQDRGGDGMNPKCFLGALRLLYVHWPSNQDDHLRHPILPLSERAFSLLERDFGLPRCFLADFGRRESTPTRFEMVPHFEGTKLGMYFQILNSNYSNHGGRHSCMQI